MNLVRGGMLGYLCGVLWYAGSCSWIYQTMYLYGGLPKPIAVGILILFSLYLGLYHALFAVLLVRLRNSRLGVGGALVLSPFLWVAVELLRGRLTGFPWDLLGGVEVGNLLVTRVAPLAGVMAISFLVMLVNAAFAGGLLLRSRRWLLGCAAVTAIVLEGGGVVVARRVSTEAGAANNVAVMMQENIAVGASGRGGRPLDEGEELRQFSASSLDAAGPDGRFAGLRGEGRKVIVWPEAPSHLRSDDPAVREQLGDLARRSGAAVIAGGLGIDAAPRQQRGYLLYDSAMLIDPAGDYRGRYDKIHLVPWGEFIPYKEFFSFAHKLTEGAGDMDRGQERRVFFTGGHGYGVFICYESIFGNEVREFVRDGADVLVNISDDGWYGDTGAPWQHLNMARMRAIENHRWVLRSTNTGVTTAIDPYGRMAAEAPRHVRAAYGFKFGFERELTFYTRHGDWFAYGCALISVGALGFSLMRRVALK